jgi:hypothetical protein
MRSRQESRGPQYARNGAKGTEGSRPVTLCLSAPTVAASCAGSGGNLIGCVGCIGHADARNRHGDKQRARQGANRPSGLGTCSIAYPNASLIVFRPGARKTVPVARCAFRLYRLGAYLQIVIMSTVWKRMQDIPANWRKARSPRIAYAHAYRRRRCMPLSLWP